MNDREQRQKDSLRRAAEIFGAKELADTARVVKAALAEEAEEKAGTEEGEALARQAVVAQRMADELDPRIRPEIRALLQRSSPVTREEWRSLTCNSWEYGALVGKLDSEALLHTTRHVLDNCTFDRARPFTSYNDAALGLYLPLLMKRFEEVLRDRDDLQAQLDAIDDIPEDAWEDSEAGSWIAGIRNKGVPVFISEDLGERVWDGKKWHRHGPVPTPIELLQQAVEEFNVTLRNRHHVHNVTAVTSVLVKEVPITTVIELQAANSTMDLLRVTCPSNSYPATVMFQGAQHSLKDDVTLRRYLRLCLNSGSTWGIVSKLSK